MSKRTFNSEMEKVPDGIKHSKYSRYSSHSTRSFDVSVSHEKLPSNKGVRFNVETVPKASKYDIDKQSLSRQDFLDGLRHNSITFYETKSYSTYIRLEAASSHKDDNLIDVGGNGFLDACVTAFAEHLPLELSPDHVWSLISYAFAKHVDENAEELRKNFVQHEGKKRLVVETPDSFKMSQENDPDSGASAKDWQRHVFPNFSTQIEQHIGKSTHSLIASKFSTSTDISNASNEIVLMSAMKNYFSYGMCTTLCGIPSITLSGTEEDWVSLRNRTEALGKLMQQDFSSYWMPLLLPILDEFVASYKGNVNHGFWQSIVKLRDNGMGSGRRSFYSGWIQVLFPYLNSGKLNRGLHPWQEMFFSGPEPKHFPRIISSAAVDWEYLDSTFNLHFHAGLVGVSQNSSDGTLTPVNGWYVTHDPPQPSAKRLKEVETEIEALSKGHKEDVWTDASEENRAGHKRLTKLKFERDDLKKARK